MLISILVSALYSKCLKWFLFPSWVHQLKPQPSIHNSISSLIAFRLRTIWNHPAAINLVYSIDTESNQSATQQKVPSLRTPYVSDSEKLCFPMLREYLFPHQVWNHVLLFEPKNIILLCLDQPIDVSQVLALIVHTVLALDPSNVGNEVQWNLFYSFFQLRV